MQGRDSIGIWLMNAENVVSFSLLHYESLLSKVHRREYKGPIAISVSLDMLEQLLS